MRRPAFRLPLQIAYGPELPLETLMEQCRAAFPAQGRPAHKGHHHSPATQAEARQASGLPHSGGPAASRPKALRLSHSTAHRLLTDGAAQSVQLAAPRLPVLRRHPCSSGRPGEWRDPLPQPRVRPNGVPLRARLHHSELSGAPVCRLCGPLGLPGAPLDQAPCVHGALPGARLGGPLHRGLGRSS